jgi:hypothetical protein
MRKVVFILAVALIIVGVVMYDRNDNAPQPQLVNAPLHVFSHGTVRVCAEDKREDGYETKITASTGHLSKPSRSERLNNFVNTATNKDGKTVFLVSRTKVCSEYYAPWVEKPTTLLLRAWQNGEITDEAKVKLMPDMF